jgi:predicted transcriptional regulator
MKNKVSVERFIKTYMKVYNKGGNQADIARELGVTQANVSLRVKHLINIGVELPKMKRKKNYDANYLNKIVANYS